MMKLVLVEWEDSCTRNAWHPLDSDYEGIARCITSGLKIAETDVFITVTTSMSNNRRVCDSISIPKSCIKRIRYLKVK